MVDDELIKLVGRCIAHIHGPGAYFSAHQRLAMSIEAAAALDTCPHCAKLKDACLRPGTSVITALKKGVDELSQGNKAVAEQHTPSSKGWTHTPFVAAELPEDLILCIRAIANLQSKLTKEFYHDLVAAATQFSTLSLTEDETRAAAAEVISLVALTCSLITLLECLDLTEQISLPQLLNSPDFRPLEARRLSAMGSTVAQSDMFGPVMGKIGLPPPGESLPMLNPFKGLGLVPFEAVFSKHWVEHLYMAIWKIPLAAYGLGARSALSRQQMELVVEHYTGPDGVGCSY